MGARWGIGSGRKNVEKLARALTLTDYAQRSRIDWRSVVGQVTGCILLDFGSKRGGELRKLSRGSRLISGDEP